MFEHLQMCAYMTAGSGIVMGGEEKNSERRPKPF